MPNIPHGDRIRELEMTVASQVTHQKLITDAVESLGKAHQETVDKLNEHRLDCAQKFAVLEEKIAKLETAQNKAADRLWSIIPPILAAVIAAALTWFFTRNAL